MMSLIVIVMTVINGYLIKEQVLHKTAEVCTFWLILCILIW